VSPCRATEPTTTNAHLTQHSGTSYQHLSASDTSSAEEMNEVERVAQEWAVAHGCRTSSMVISNMIEFPSRTPRAVCLGGGEGILCVGETEYEADASSKATVIEIGDTERAIYAMNGAHIVWIYNT